MPISFAHAIELNSRHTAIASSAHDAALLLIRRATAFYAFRHAHTGVLRYAVCEASLRHKILFMLYAAQRYAAALAACHCSLSFH